MNVGKRNEAKLLGQSTYFTGKPCARGHVSLRNTVDGACKECKSLRDTSVERKRYDREYRLANPEKLKSRSRKYKQENKHIINAHNAKRRASKKSATPSWADLDKIKEIYKDCPKGYQVDHIVPLINPKVCGLHVEYNLQYLTKEENLQKYNKLI